MLNTESGEVVNGRLMGIFLKVRNAGVWADMDMVCNVGYIICAAQPELFETLMQRVYRKRVLKVKPTVL